jgi:hypothetical protein
MVQQQLGQHAAEGASQQGLTKTRKPVIIISTDAAEVEGAAGEGVPMVAEPTSRTALSVQVTEVSWHSIHMIWLQPA